MESKDTSVRVLYSFEYTKEGRNVWMKEGETLYLLKKTNPDWWQVIRNNERKPFYVPAAYVEEVYRDKSGKNFVSNESSGSQRKKCVPLKRDRISDKNLFKEFPKAENQDEEKQSEVETSFREQSSSVDIKSKHFNQKLEELGDEQNYNGDEEEQGGVQKVLHDKRKSWAAEELVSELTQMAIARSEATENDYVNLRVDGSRFVIAADEEVECGVSPPLFWHSSSYVKDSRHNPTSSSEELDNSDSLGQNSCVVWQSKYSLSSEGDKTDESIQSFHSLGNESVSSRHWKDESREDPEPSPYAQVLCASATSLDVNSHSEATKNCESGCFGTEVLKLSASLEELAQQIKFPCEETRQKESEQIQENIGAIAPPREYEAPVYENIDVQVGSEAKEEQDAPVEGLDSNFVFLTPCENTDEKMLKSIKTKILQSSCIAPLLEDKCITEKGESSPHCDQENCSSSPNNPSDDCDNDGNHYEPVELPKQVEWTSVSAKVKKLCDNESDSGDRVLNSDEYKIEGIVDVKKKIALWNSGAESDDRFDEDGKPRKLSVSPKFRAFRSFGVVKSASESKVSALVNRHGVYYPGSRSGSEEFLDNNVDGSPISEDASADWANRSCQSIPRRVEGSPQLNPEGDNLDASDSGLSNKSDEAILGSHGDSASKRRKTSLIRNRRVESCRRFQRLAAAPAPGAAVPVARPQSPPPPSPGQEAARLLPAGWAEFRTADGRSFYYHAASGQRRWKPPRRRTAQQSQDSRSTSSSPLQGEEDDQDGEREREPDAAPGPLPAGWRAVVDESGQLCYVHPHQPAKWFSSFDNKGRVYFFEENSNESSWTLPNVVASSPQIHEQTSRELTDEDDYPPKGSTASLASQLAAQLAKYKKVGVERTSAERDTASPTLSSGDHAERTEKDDRNERSEKVNLRATKSRSMVIVESCETKDSKHSTVPRNWPQLFEGDMYVLKEGPLNRTKITENGKKLRKNWASSHVVLTELFLLLFRDSKAFSAMKSASSASSSPRPELCVDLNGALIDQVDRGEKASVTSRKNVFLVSTVLGLQVLFQCDCSQQSDEWYNAVHTAIHNLPSGFDSCPRIKVTKEMDRLFSEANSPEQVKKFPRIGRSKSVKIKNKDGSIEDLTVSPAERQTKIRARLKKFFNRRPTMESLVKKGIWKDEPAFGCYLEQVCGTESPRVPLFVQRCVTVIEGNLDNMKTDGLYRASGNLSQVQKIRLQVDQNNLSALDQEEDVHVLTGALKLFFRELKEPLIPFAAFSKAIKASTNPNKKEKLSQFRDIVKSLPVANHDTLKFLLKHLLRVTNFQEFNRMHIPNLAIVFGPTLMWPEQESLNMALDLMQQNLVIETFLLDFDNIFR